MTLPPFLSEKDGEILLTGHRIGLYYVVTYYNDGYSPEMLACQFPTLELALIHKVIAFYLENRAGVDTYVAQYAAEMERQRAASAPPVSVAELRQRLEKMRSGLPAETS